VATTLRGVTSMTVNREPFDLNFFGNDMACKDLSISNGVCPVPDGW